VTYIVFPSNTVDIIDSIRGAIGRIATFNVVASSVACTTCGVDPITGDALDAFCPTCSGEGYIYTYSGTEISGHITWGVSELLGWERGGQTDVGDCRVQIKYTVANEATVNDAISVTVDNRTMDIKSRILRGVPEINRILVDCVERDKN